MTLVKIKVEFQRQGEPVKNWNIKVSEMITVSQLQVKLRQFAKLNEHEACFLFFKYKGFLGQKKEKIYSGSHILAEIKRELNQDVLEVIMCIDNTYGELDSRFINATIQELNIGVWVLTINYSFYNLYNYKNVYVFKSMEDAIKKLALERTNDKLEIKNKNNDIVKIDGFNN